MADIKKLKGSKIKFNLTVEEKDLKATQQATMDYFREHANLKGFRKGHATDEMIIQTVGEGRIEYEKLSRAVEKKYRAFVAEHKLAPVAQPKVDFPEKTEAPLDIVFEVEVFPEAKLGDYSKVKLQKPKAEADEKEVTEFIESLMSQFGQKKNVQRAAQKNDALIVDFAGKDKDGNVIPNTKGEQTPLHLGKGYLLSDLEDAFVGMKAGDSKKDVAVKFPKDYHSKDFAGKTVMFDITLHEVAEIDIKNLDEKAIQAMSGQNVTLDDFKKDVKKTLDRQKQTKEHQEQIQKFNEALLKVTKVELPESWLAKEVEIRMGRLHNDPKFQHDPEAFWASIKKDEAGLKKEFETQAIKDLTLFVALSQVLKEQSIELDESEMRRAHAMAHQAMGKGHNEDHNSNAHAEAMSRAVMNAKIDKYIESLMV